MKMLFVLALTMFTAQAANAYVVPTYRDIKPATQKMIEFQAIDNPGAASTSNILLNNAGNTSTAAVTVSTFLTQPDVARNLVITPGGTTNDVGSCSILVTGKDYLNNTITENFAFAANASSATTGNKAFKSITSIYFPANCEDTPFGATWSVGWGEKIGVKRCMNKAGHILFSTLNGAKEATAPTMAADASTVSLNTADFNGTMNGTNDFELLFIQNFRCTN